MRMKVFFPILSCLLLVISCKETHEITNSNYEINIDKVTYLDSINISTIYKDAHVIYLDTASHAMISEISKLVVYDDKIIILDKKARRQILVFNKSGEYLYSIGKMGLGPGEYTYIRDFTYSSKDNLLFILDSQTRKIHKYQLNTGKYLNTITCEHSCYHLHYYDGKLFVDHPSLHHKLPSSYLLEEINVNSGEKLNSYISPDDYNKGFDNPLSNFGGPFLLSNQDQFKYSLFFAQVVFTYENEEIKPYLTLNSDEWMQSKDIAGIDVDEDPMGVMKIFQKNKYFEISRYIENDKFIFFKINKGFHNRYIFLNKNGEKAFMFGKLKENLIFDDINFSFLKLEYGANDTTGSYYYLSPDKADILLKKYYQENPFFKKSAKNFNGAIVFYEY